MSSLLDAVAIAVNPKWEEIFALKRRFQRNCTAMCGYMKLAKGFQQNNPVEYNTYLQKTLSIAENNSKIIEELTAIEPSISCHRYDASKQVDIVRQLLLNNQVRI